MSKIVLYNQEKDCCGCGACANICPKLAITMKENQYGFVYPEIDESKCVSCKLCQKICAFQSMNPIDNCVLDAYAGVSIDTDVMKSASGGIFASIAQSFLKNGGIVFGSALIYQEGKLVPKCISVSNETDLVKLLGSKYVHSSMENCFCEMKQKLNQGKSVLFCGTPCQVDAVKHFVGKKNAGNLYCIDIICHGVPAARFFQDYIRQLEKKYGKKILDFKFRYKREVWRICIKFGNYLKNKYIYFNESSYYYFFINGAIQRENCYHCKYACTNRIGDLTIGDYWGIEKMHPEYLRGIKGMKPSKGISCILVNTDQGEKLLSKYGDGLDIRKSELSKIIPKNKQLTSPNNVHPSRKVIFDLYNQNGYESVERYFRKYRGASLWIDKIRNRRMTVLKKLKFR